MTFLGSPNHIFFIFYSMLMNKTKVPSPPQIHGRRARHPAPGDDPLGGARRRRPVLQVDDRVPTVLQEAQHPLTQPIYLLKVQLPNVQQGVRGGISSQCKELGFCIYVCYGSFVFFSSMQVRNQ